MGIGEPLQEALVNANNERINWHDAVQDLDGELVELRATLRSAETKKAGADSIHKAADEKYHELLAFSNNSMDQDGKRALGPQIEVLAGNVNFTVGSVREAGEEVQRRRREMEKVEKQRTVAQLNLNAATERWEQIKKQIAELRQ
jgi:hypothetical protein